MRKLTVSEILSLSVLFLALSGCSHITHRARVNEGLNMSAFVMPGYETYDPPKRYWDDRDNFDRSFRYSRTDYQVGWGYGWKLKSGRKAMLNLNTASTFAFPYEFFPSVGLYCQTTPDSLRHAAGVGAVILPDPLIYWLWGRDLGRTKSGIKIAELELGAGFGLYPSFFLHLKLLKQIGPLHAGLISEYRRFWPYTGISLGADGYVRDYIKSQLYFGIILIPEFQ